MMAVQCYSVGVCSSADSSGSAARRLYLRLLRSKVLRETRALHNMAIWRWILKRILERILSCKHTKQEQSKSAILLSGRCGAARENRWWRGGGRSGGMFLGSQEVYRQCPLQPRQRPCPLPLVAQVQRGGSSDSSSWKVLSSCRNGRGWERGRSNCAIYLSTSFSESMQGKALNGAW